MTTRDDALQTRLFLAVIEATTDDPTGHLPNCGYTDEEQVCGCAEWGRRLGSAIRAILDAHEPATEPEAPSIEDVLATHSPFADGKGFVECGCTYGPDRVNLPLMGWLQWNAHVAQAIRETGAR